MRRLKLTHTASLLMLASLLSACAGMTPTISAPGVTLRNVQVQDVDFSGQTFLLGFDVTNPNPFPMPVRFVSYGVELDGQHFAAGRTESAFTVAAQSDSEFAISVKLDLLRTAPQLLYIVHDAVTRDIPYKLKGKLGVDIPLVKPINFEANGEIRLYAGKF